jgi:Xaa-Pro aminopeptidase
MYGKEQHKRLLAELEKADLDTLLLLNLRLPHLDESFYYFTGCSEFEKAAAVLGETPKIWVADFEVPRASKDSWIENLKPTPEKKPLEEIARELHDLKVGVNENFMPASIYKKLENVGVKMFNFSEQIERMRMVKTSEEIELLQQAVDITLDMMRGIDAGKSEQDISAYCAEFLRRKGADFAYDPIIAFDENSAMPHAKTTNKKGEHILLLDLGAKYKGYHADITRVKRLKRDVETDLVYEAVKGAHDEGIDAVKPGVKASEVDTVVRDYLKKSGHDLVHSTGHGIGLSIHEKPNISQKAEKDIVLEEGMVFTIEPGVYLKGKFGIRIEDDILVTSEGCRVLSR